VTVLKCRVRGTVMCIALRVAGSVALAGFCLLSSASWLSGAWGQNVPLQLVQARPAPIQSRPGLAQSRLGSTKQNKAFALQPVPAQQVPAAAPIVFPVTNPSSALGTTLAACEPKLEASEFSLPGARGEVRLDRCYRGRDHLVCHLHALMSEAKFLLDNYRRIIDANYPEVRDTGGICAIKPDTLADDLLNAADFTNRFKALKAEYEAEASCANRIEQSLTQVTLPDMTQAPILVKSMVDAIEADVKDISEVQGKLTELADKMDSSQKSIATLQKIHRAICMVRPNRKAETD
jgi:hypothetical protein